MNRLMNFISFCLDLKKKGVSLDKDVQNNFPAKEWRLLNPFDAETGIFQKNQVTTMTVVPLALDVARPSAAAMVLSNYKWVRACFLSLAWSKLRLCSANHRPGYWSNLPCDWPSTAWAYSEQERKWVLVFHEEGFHQSVPSQHVGMISMAQHTTAVTSMCFSSLVLRYWYEMQIYFYILPKKNSAHKRVNEQAAWGAVKTGVQRICDKQESTVYNT